MLLAFHIDGSTRPQCCSTQVLAARPRPFFTTGQAWGKGGRFLFHSSTRETWEICHSDKVPILQASEDVIKTLPAVPQRYRPTSHCLPFSV